MREKSKELIEAEKREAKEEPQTSMRRGENEKKDGKKHEKQEKK